MCWLYRLCKKSKLCSAFQYRECDRDLNRKVVNGFTRSDHAFKAMNKALTELKDELRNGHAGTE